jgi:hypothetical protein
MFFVFLISISMLTLIVTACCLRVLGEAYHEALVSMQEEEREQQEQQQQRQHQNEYEDEGRVDDDAFWNPYYEYNHRNDTDATTSHRQQPFHYRVAFRTLSSLPIEVAFGLFSLLCAWSLTSLTCFHALIITLAQTTNERVRGVYQYGGIGNPADEGCWRNWLGVCCKEIPESRIPSDFSEVVTLPVDFAEEGVDGESKEGKKGEESTQQQQQQQQQQQPVVEETLWPGWQYSQSFTSLMSSAPPSSVNQQ